MPVSIDREIGRLRAQPGHNWTAIALQTLQDYVNKLPTAAATPSAPSTPTVQIGSGGGASSSTPSVPFAFRVNGAIVANNTASLNNALPPAPAGYVNCVIQLDNTLPVPNVSVSSLVGTPNEVGASDLTAQSAAITTVTLFTPSATGAYRVAYSSKITTVSSGSSVLGGATGFVLGYKDGGDSVAQTPTLPGFDQTGTPIVIATGNTANTTAAIYQGSGLIFALAGTAITYSFGYSSTGVTPMQFEIHVRIEAM